MKKLFVLFVALLMLASPIVLAEEELSVDSGTTPDSALWGIDRAMERLELALTFGSAAKAKKRLEIARERLAEIRAMAKKKNIDALEKAQEAHDEILAEAEQDIEDASQKNEEENLELVAKIGAELEDHEQDLDKVESDIDLNDIEDLTDQQKVKLDKILDKIQSSKEKAMERFEIKKENALKRWRAKNEKTKEQAAEKMKQIKEKIKSPEIQEKLIEKAVERLNQKIEKLSEITAKAKEKGKDVTLMEERLGEAKTLVEEIKGKTYEEARPLIQKINRLLNFRQVYMAVASKKVKEKLQALESKRIEIAKEIKDLKLKQVIQKPLIKAKIQNLKKRAISNKVSKENTDSTQTTPENKSTTNSDESITNQGNQ